MKTVDPNLSTAIRSAYNLYARPRLTVEWNLNRYYSVSADNIAAETDYAYDAEYFPIEDIYKPNRPTKGVVKGRADQMILSDNDPLKQDVRFYISSPDNIYKYWTSPVPTDGTGTFPTYTAAWATAQGNTGDANVDNLTVVRPFIKYTTLVKTNKIVIKTENSWSTPNSYSVLVQNTVGGAWTSVGAAGTTGLNNSTGQLTLWWNGSAWTGTKPSGTLQTTSIAGVMFRVDSLTAGRNLSGAVTTYKNKSGTVVNTTGFNSYFELIEIAACLEADLSNKFISANDTFDMAEKSLVYPIGTITANGGQITLSNIYTDAELGIGSSTAQKVGLFNPGNTQSPYQNLAEQNAVFNLEYVFTVNNVDYAVQQFKMYGGAWGTTTDDQVTVPLRDYSKFFDEQTPEPLFWMNRSVSELIWRLCDSVGFVDYKISIAATDEQPIINYFWSDGEKTLWQIFDELSRATQTAIYIDAWGVLQVRSRGHAFDTTASPVWNLRSRNSGGDLADIISLEQTDEVATNYVTITYYASDLTDWNNGYPKLETVWQPDGTVALRAAILRKSMTAGDTTLVMNSTDAQIWPFSGIIQVEGELIKYDAKQYFYTDTTGTQQTVWVESQEQFEKFEKASRASDKYKNHWTGKLRISERGVWNSEAKSHNVEALGYSVRRILNGNPDSSVNGFKHQPSSSTVRMTSTPNFKKSTDLLVATRGAATDTPFYYFGTRLRFKSTGRKDQKAGIVFNNSGTNELGYYIEIQSSAKVDRKKRNELTIWTKPGSGSGSTVGGKGRATSIAEDRWIDIDVAYVPGSPDRVIVAINGKTSLDVNISGADKVASGGRWGMFLRGDTDVEYEYLYAVNHPPGEGLDETTFWDRVNGGYLGSQWDAEWVYKMRKTTRRERKKTHKKQKRWNQLYMDEFGPWLHEVRDFSVKFDPKPVLHTKFLFSSDEAICTEYRSGSFDAHFVLANKARRNVIINGDDSGQFTGTGDSVNNVLMIFGRVVEVKEAQTVIKSNDDQIRVKGKVETELDSPWIQSEAAANKLAQWINNHWSTGADEQTAVIFGNPLFEIGDVVAIDHADRYMTVSTHKYFVTSIDTSWENGISTTLTLRRVT